MNCTKESILQWADSLLLVAVFLFQSVILNYLVINQFIQSSFTFLWFLGDFICLLIFAFTLYLAFRLRWKERNGGSLKGSTSLNNSRNSSRNGNRSVSPSAWTTELNCFSRISKTPFIYIAWIVYTCTIIAKIVVLFKAPTHPRELRSDEFFGPQMLKVAICLSAIIFSLLVEAHHDAQGDPVRNCYVKSLSHGMALEILDSVSFLSLLIVQETHLMYTFAFESFVLGLTSINLMLPAVALYKLSVSGFGETYPLPLEILYKLLHLFLVNVPYLSVRIYLWQYFSYSDTSIFMVKNIYSIVALLRSVMPDLRKAYLQCTSRKAISSRPISNLSGTSPNGNKNGIVKRNEEQEDIALSLTTFAQVDESEQLHRPNSIPHLPT